MYLSQREAKIAQGLHGLGFDWGSIGSVFSPIATAVTGLVTQKKQAEAAEAVAKAQAKVAAAQAKVAEATKALSVGPGGATMPTQPASVWQNKWTWVALAGGAILAGAVVMTVFKKKG